MKYDVVIIGAGMAGLAAAIRLAHYERKVCIVEQHSLVGGLNSFYRRYGHNFEVGLHAMTNFTGPRTRGAPLQKLLRQLRLKYDDLQLCPQHFSLIQFPDTELKFTNDFADFEAEIDRTFPAEIDGFNRLVEVVNSHDAYSLEAPFVSTRDVLSQHIEDPLLHDMLLCPLMFYGNSAESDMDFSQFCIMFRSIFLEGFCRPQGGVRHILNVLLQRYAETGGELLMNCAVERISLTDNQVNQINLTDGRTIEAAAVLSSAGYLETLQLCDPVPEEARYHPPGQMSFLETIFVLDKMPCQFGIDSTILFRSNLPSFHYARPASLIDDRSMVLCVPNNFQLPPDEFSEGIVRITRIADYEPWCRMERDEYQNAKDQTLEHEFQVLDAISPDIRSHVICTDMFTPRTIARFTGHIHGAVYGSPLKSREGRTPVSNLFVCGTDQGFLGIIGALLSGVSIANARLLT